MAGFKSMVVVMVFTVLASFQLQSTLAQTSHVVGGSLRWTVPPNTTAYTSWAATQTFRVGDTLFFNFTTGFHDVLQVSQSAYGPCTFANPISTYSNGPANITLNATGNHYYVCAVGAHCTQFGQKVMVNVLGASGNSTPPAATSPPPSGSTPSTPPATTSPPPPPPNSASTLTAVVPVAFFLAALALVL